MYWMKVKDVVPHKSIELSLFRNEGFIFPEKLGYQGLSTFVQMKGDCYPYLVRVFYNNIKVVDGNIHSRVKRVDIVINNDTWLQVADLKGEGHMSHRPDCLQSRIPTNWIAVFKWHIIDVGENDWLELAYGVFISKILSLSGVNLTGETKVTYNKANQIGKAILTCIGLKKTALGWIFNDKQTSTKDKYDVSDFDSESTLKSPKSKFENMW
ncbi:hypothetical protein LR48_Vigan08g083700 [Vigna angularis]|uniref:Uncharacterized protein n=1 Tax=Phaseolus angularis TaxID=3914 RepID=A0A0L9V4M8_PHAAN|nr:hypothetical protein LR48_Vigan08g083700 [Vigna angularis]